ncbi:EamA/RhaT family transporter [Bacillus sp. M6-12]|uniref:DMT family transporter n=1 Tax=Bacillus sp. M6-12 TaxID=2054166 RepID=UPI000C76598A|nr:DMT family transporter [Bacillus sp. M6-12]PLS14653.1 EamA/RhaT family transporter [Bacillus sp. M6-12]
MAKSYITLFFCVFVWAGNYLARQFLLTEFSPLFLSAFSLTVVSIFFFSLALITKSFVRLQRNEIILLCIAGLIGLIANQIFLFTGLKYSSATNASLIFSLAPLITAVLANVFLKEKITRQMIFGSVIAIVGIYLVLSINGHFEFNIGDLLLLGGTATFSCNLIFVRLLSRRLSSMIITTYSFIIGAILFDPFVLAGTAINWKQSFYFWVFALMSVIIGQGITTMMWNKAMNAVGAARSAIVLNLQPLMTMLLNFWIFHNTVTVKQMFGAALVFAGILLSTAQNGISIHKQAIKNDVGNKEISKKEIS